MKKILSIAAALVVAAAFISCGDSSDSFDGSTDTVITISAPSVTAKAYPGVNYITWTPVSGAKTYELYRSDDGDSNKLLKVVDVATAGAGAELGYADIAATGPTGGVVNSALSIADGKTYKYTVLAVGGNNSNANVNVPSRAVYLKGNQSSASVKAIVPAAGTKIAEFKDSYTKDFLKKFDEKNLAKNVVITSNLFDQGTYANPAKVNQFDWGKYWITYPATAGYKFSISAVNPSELAATHATTAAAVSSTTTANYKENYTANAAATTLGSGTVDFYLTIDNVAPLYQPVVTKIGTLTVPGLEEKTNTGTVTAKYTAADKAVVYFTPAKLLKDGKAVATTDYIVYRTSDADNNKTFTKLDVTITAQKTSTGVTGSTPAADYPTTYPDTNTTPATAETNKYTDSDVYAFTDTIADNTVDYKYYVVLYNAESKLYGKATGAATLPAWKNPATKTPTLTWEKVISKDKGVKNQIMLVAKKADPAQTLKLSWIKLGLDPQATTAGTTIPVWAKYDNEVTLTDNFAGDNLTYVYYFTGDYDTSYFFKLTASEGTKDTAQACVVAKVKELTPDLTVTDLNLYMKDATNGAVFLKDSDISTANPISNYKYTLYTVTTTVVSKDYGEYVTVTTDKGTAMDAEKLKATTIATYNLTAPYAENDENVVYATVSKPKALTDPTKVSSYTSMRYYVTKQYVEGSAVKGAVKTSDSKAAWTNFAQ